ncbi:hypothetical protein DM860_002582 [Cuscuta australis]|uniref:Pectinesterase inhibitor domain-containing protein n=1 Tax=Cuscuta australis TaxID=267555 RepID=A0A328CZ97_9ASTE|nr:hypothetical protein DM860_002582 [Cuscuta australis]
MHFMPTITYLPTINRMQNLTQTSQLIERKNQSHNMAFYHNLATILFGILLLPLIFFTNVHGDVIDDVCAKALRPPLCQKVLRGDPRSKNADLKTLGSIAIDITTKQAKSGQSLVQSLLKKATDPKQKSALSTCVENYGDSIDNLRECPGLLRSGDYGGVNIKASAAFDDFETCNDGFSDLSIPEPPKLKDSSSMSQGVCDIILVISNLLKTVAA